MADLFGIPSRFLGLGEQITALSRLKSQDQQKGFLSGYAGYTQAALDSGSVL